MFKRGAVILATLVVAAGLFVGVSRTGSAEAATSCYGGAVNENFNINNGFPKDYGPFYTTSRCNDINMRLTTDIAGVFLDACVVFVKYTNQSGVLRNGQRYEVRNVQNMFGAVVASGTYSGAGITLPMNGVNAPARIGRTTPTPKTSTSSWPSDGRKAPCLIGPSP